MLWALKWALKWALTLRHKISFNIPHIAKKHPENC